MEVEKLLSEKTIDIKENDLLKIDPELLAILLKDKTTGNNIIWATDNYSKYGFSYTAEKEIRIELITSRHGGIIKPRIEKSKTEQQQRVRQKAEVFTPSWICNMQNNKGDEEWFNRKDVFNFEKKTWQDYILSKRLEMSCGEASYITSRYDAVTGEYIEVPNRIGILDRKLRIVSENTETRETWLNVPLQDFTANSDIDWSKSIPEIDKQLYKKYGLSADEVEFIESKVREM